MTVDESPISPATTGTQASNATNANSTPKDPKATMVNAAGKFFHYFTLSNNYFTKNITHFW